ncbi:hypothetical protein L6164_008430 [Bauhinia variegata]|nr:hypothetical protein L6164_008430 [Bauhinia variegata]
MNRTLVERVRCLLSEAKLPGSFWGEALYTAAHVINLSPAIALQSDVPDRVWYGKDVFYDHLHVFSCKAFVHVPKDERSKLDAKTRQCVFIGYGHDDFSHRFYDPVEKSVSGLVDLDPTPTLVSVTLDVVEHDNNGENVQDVQVENNGGDNTIVDAPAHRAVDEPTVPLRRINLLKKELSKSFAMKDLGLARQILGMEIIYDRKSKKLWLSQEKYIEKVLQRFYMNKAKAVSTPLANHFKLSTRHAPFDDDEKARIDHWNAVKWIMRYLRGTSSLKLCFGIGEPILHGYTDSDLARDVDTRKSTSGYLVTFAGGVVA